jgi:hypothetical protein
VKLALSALLFLALSAFSGCPHNPTPSPTPVTADAAPVADTPCASYCQLVDTKLHCTFAAPTAAGASCLDVCRNANNPAGPIAWDFTCRLSKTSCADIATCQ